MRKALIVLIILFIVPSVAFADSGYSADFHMVLEFGEFFSMFGGIMRMEGADDSGAELPDTVEMTGRMSWTDKFMRLDLDPFEGTHESTITDIDGNVTYKLDHVSKTASRIEVEEFDSELLMGADMPDPEALASDWEGFIEAMAGVEGAVVNELAPREIDGYHCNGFSFVIDMSKTIGESGDGSTGSEDDEMSAMLGAMMSAMGGYSGEIWVAEDISMPLSMTLSTVMMDYTWGLSNVEGANLADSLFQVPPDYEIVELELPDMSELSDPALIGPQQPAPAGQ